MRVLFGTDNFYPNVNGSANFSINLAKGLVKLGHEVTVIAPAREFKYTVTYFEGMTIYGVPSIMIPKIIHPAGIRIPLEINNTIIKSVINKIQPDVIHIQDHFMIGSRVALLGRKLHIPTVGTNNFMPENFLPYFPSLDFAQKSLSKFGWWQFINVYKHLDFITSSTKTAVDLIKGLGLKNPALAISCGVDLNKFTPKIKGDDIKKLFHIPASQPVILFVGRLDKEKKIDVIIKAFAIILKSTDARLVIAGKGKERSNLANLSKRLGIMKKIIFTGFINDQDLPRLYRIADIFTIASIAELQSIVTMEAMASGLPVVGARVMALPELISHGRNGYLFNEGDTQMLAESAIKILKNPGLRKKMSENSLKIIRRNNFNKTVEIFERIYKNLIFSSGR